MQRGTEAFSLSALVSFAVPLAFYAATLTPGVAFWDIGEMQTVPYVLGIPHPTGFPLFVLLGWCASHAPLAGDPAWRVSLLCAIASAASAALLSTFVRALTASGVLGAAAALVFAFGDIVWTRAIRADVHDLALACVAAAIVAAERAGRTNGARPLGAAAFAAGLALATHPLALLAYPCLMVLAFPALRHATAAERLRAAALFAAPLALYAYIPLRSAFVEAHGLDPGADLGLAGSALFDDGSPSTPAAFWRYVSGSTFGPGGTLAASASLGGIGRATHFLGAVLTREFAAPLLALAAFGCAALWLRRPRVASALALLVLGGAVFAANYRVEVDPDRYALPGLWAAVACAAYGAGVLATLPLREHRRLATALGAALLLATLGPRAPAAYADVRERTVFDDARELGPQIALRTRDGSVFVATWSFATPLLYERYVARSFGTRRIVCGWPPAYGLQLLRWRKRFGHVYFVVGSAYDVSPLGRSLYARGRWQLAEMR